MGSGSLERKCKDDRTTTHLNECLVCSSFYMKKYHYPTWRARIKTACGCAAGSSAESSVLIFQLLALLAGLGLTVLRRRKRGPG